LIYTVKKRHGAWVIDANGVMLNFESYLEAVNTAQGAAETLRRSRNRLSRVSWSKDIPVPGAYADSEPAGATIGTVTQEHPTQRVETMLGVRRCADHLVLTGWDRAVMPLPLTAQPFQIGGRRDRSTT